MKELIASSLSLANGFLCLMDCCSFLLELKVTGQIIGLVSKASNECCMLARIRP